jgi:hypothetical protein
MVVKILAPLEPAIDVLYALRQFEAAGIPNIWMLDPDGKRAFTYKGDVLRRMSGGTISTADPIIQLQLDDVFRGV